MKTQGITLVKNSVLLLMTVAIVLLNGCVHPNNEEIIPPVPPGEDETKSQLLFTFSNEGALRSTEEDTEPLVFTGDDILWFNETTTEIRFKENVSQINTIKASSYKSIKFYIDDDYLFLSLICVSDINSQIFSSLVFYYSQMENRFYLKDGYPDISSLSASQQEKAQELRNENRKKIEVEWNRFINQLKKEKRYIE